MPSASSAETVLDYISVLIWPLVVLTVLLLYRDKIAGLIERITEVRGPAGTGIVAPVQQATGSTQEDEAVFEEEPFAGLVEFYEQQLEEAQDEQETLIQRLIIKEFEADFERLYNNIFGSQQRALRALRAAEPVGLPRAQVEPMFQVFHEQVRLSFPAEASTWTFEAWMNYLLNESYGGSLAGVDQATGNYRITLKGNAFLAYIEGLGRPDKLW